MNSREPRFFHVWAHVEAEDYEGRYTKDSDPVKLTTVPTEQDARRFVASLPNHHRYRTGGSE